ncbi:M24 family metallopeptidase [Pelagibius sp. Alg239-R121]|uniref:M24 family metallopeptidase n=1 Tax=Pelagibius sp. Alg239-R121 TaxID=2993448 RepID=UPI0024A6BC16|nr:M24 family metallopeptidase [Pelagibius sp. Alg239-R121]
MEQFLKIRNGAKVTPTFSASESERRLKMLRDHMASEDLEAVLFTSIHNINYFSDFLYCAFGRTYGLVVTQDKAITLSANIDGGQPHRRSVGDNLVYTDWQKDNYFRAVQNEIGGRKRIGVEFDHLNLQNHAKLGDALPGATFSDVGAPTMRMRMIKSDEEIELIKHGAQVGDIGGAHCVEAIAENVPEYEVALHSTRAMVREIAKRFPHGELMDTWTWFQSGLNTDGAHNPVTSRKVQKGDILSLNCFPMIAGYYTALERTLFLDHASDRHLELWEVNCRVHRRGLELIKPGARCCDIALELNEIYKEHDLLQHRTFGYGHSFGTLSHYYGREAGLELREDIETVLEPNMVVSMEPMIMLPESMEGAGGYREHDILVIQEDGAENITKFPFGPEHNIVPA